MSNIFISYRRADTKLESLLLRELLAKEFGDKKVFIDTEDIRVGDNWVETLENALKKSKVLIVMIGEKWSTIERNGVRALDLEDDWVRNEIRTSLDKNIIIYPIIIDKPNTPKLNEIGLPKDIEPLKYKQSINVREGNNSDFLPLINTLKIDRTNRFIRRLVIVLPILIFSIALLFTIKFLNKPEPSAKQKAFYNQQIITKDDSIPFIIAYEAGDLLETDSNSNGFVDADAVVIPTKVDLGEPHKPSLDCFLSLQLCGRTENKCDDEMNWEKCSYMESRKRENQNKLWAELAPSNVLLSNKQVVYAAGIDATKTATMGQVRVLTKLAIEASHNKIKHLALPIIGGATGKLDKDDALKAIIEGIKLCTKGPEKVSLILYDKNKFFKNADSEGLEKMKRWERIIRDRFN